MTPTDPVINGQSICTVADVVCDKQVDNQAALSAAFSSTKNNNKTFIIPKGVTLKHSSSLPIKVENLHITGEGTFVATNPIATAFVIHSDDVTIDGGLHFYFDTKDLA